MDCEKFDFTKYFQPIIDEFTIVGKEVEIKKKDKKSFGTILLFNGKMPFDYYSLKNIPNKLPNKGNLFVSLHTN